MHVTCHQNLRAAVPDFFSANCKRELRQSIGEEKPHAAQGLKHGASEFAHSLRIISTHRFVPLPRRCRLCLVHERDFNRGGAPLDVLREDCPEDLREALYAGRDVIGWHALPR